MLATWIIDRRGELERWSAGCNLSSSELIRSSFRLKGRVMSWRPPSARRWQIFEVT